MTKQDLQQLITDKVNPDNFDLNAEVEIFTIKYPNHIINLVIRPSRNSEGILLGANIETYETVHVEDGDVKNVIDWIELDDILYKHLKGKEWN